MCTVCVYMCTSLSFIFCRQWDCPHIFGIMFDITTTSHKFMDRQYCVVTIMQSFRKWYRPTLGFETIRHLEISSNTSIATLAAAFKSQKLDFPKKDIYPECL